MEARTWFFKIAPWGNWKDQTISPTFIKGRSYQGVINHWTNYQMVDLRLCGLTKCLGKRQVPFIRFSPRVSCRYGVIFLDFSCGSGELLILIYLDFWGMMVTILMRNDAYFRLLGISLLLFAAAGIFWNVNPTMKEIAPPFSGAKSLLHLKQNLYLW